MYERRPRNLSLRHIWGSVVEQATLAEQQVGPALERLVRNGRYMLVLVTPSVSVAAPSISCRKIRMQSLLPSSEPNSNYRLSVDCRAGRSWPLSPMTRVVNSLLVRHGGGRSSGAAVRRNDSLPKHPCKGLRAVRRDGRRSQQIRRLRDAGCCEEQMPEKRLFHCPMKRIVQQE
jgi:hypothetical protein